MNAAEHAKAAEELLARQYLTEPVDVDFVWREIDLKKAHVHAMLAVAKAWMEGVTVTNLNQ